MENLNENINHPPDRYSKLIRALWEARPAGDETVLLQVLFRYGQQMNGPVKPCVQDDTLWTMSSIGQSQDGNTIAKMDVHFHGEDVMRVEQPLGKPDDIASRIVQATVMPRAPGRGPLGG